MDGFPSLLNLEVAEAEAFLCAAELGPKGLSSLVMER